ncbi:hypothetical protein RHGRI_015774 [Rhododendron griersonianum]|uniref:Uncharacterized protein n=1 Tax=Rhododendron griersonianum TaxID=479676 RepID=A0AAV6JRL7_9ERIC|nr:hypothetical protein RHGRI_015774 [Rhododendron griersonianum]
MSTAFFFLKININSIFLVNFDRLLKGTIPKLRSFASCVFPTRLVEVRAKNGVLDPKCEVGFKIEGSVGDWDIKRVEGGGSDPELGISDLHDRPKMVFLIPSAKLVLRLKEVLVIGISNVSKVADLTRNLGFRTFMTVRHGEEEHDSGLKNDEGYAVK